MWLQTITYSVNLMVLFILSDLLETVSFDLILIRTKLIVDYNVAYLSCQI